MSTKTLERKTRELKNEVELLRSLVLGYVAKDPEGDYNPAFVRRVLRAAAEKPKHEFKDTNSFLRHLRG